MATWIEWCRQPGLVYDIGGYTGLMSILAALANDKSTVHLFEPMDRTIERAKINVRANRVDQRVRLHNRAASCMSGEADINLYLMLDPYVAFVSDVLERYPRLPASVIYEMVDDRALEIVVEQALGTATQAFEGLDVAWTPTPPTRDTGDPWGHTPGLPARGGTRLKTKSPPPVSPILPAAPHPGSRAGARDDDAALA